MPIIRFTAFFKDDDGHGWSETHDLDGGTTITSLTARLQSFNNLMITTRRPLLAGDAFYIGARASYKTVDGAIAGDNIEIDPPMRGPQTFGGETLETDAPEVAIKARFRNEAATARSDVYLRGCWDQVIQAGVLNFGSAAGAEWKRRADIYGAALVAGGYGWQGVNPALTSRGEVTSYTENDDGTVTLLVTPKNQILLPAAGTNLAVKFARLNRSKSPLNRSLVCTVAVGGAALDTIQQVAVGPFETKGTYIATVFGFIPYAALSYYRLTHRKTGRPFGVGPGRLPAKALY